MPPRANAPTIPPLPLWGNDKRVAQAKETRQKMSALRRKYAELVEFYDEHNVQLNRTTAESIALEDKALEELKQSEADHVALRDRLAAVEAKAREIRGGFDALTQPRQFDDLMTYKFPEEVTLMIVGFQLVHLGHLDAVFGVDENLKKRLSGLVQTLNNKSDKAARDQLTERLLRVAQRSVESFGEAVDKADLFEPATDRETELQARLDTESDKVYALKKQLQGAATEAREAERQKQAVEASLERLKPVIKLGINAEEVLRSRGRQIEELQKQLDDRDNQVAGLHHTIANSQEFSQRGAPDDDDAEDDDDDDDEQAELIKDLEQQIQEVQDELSEAQRMLRVRSDEVNQQIIAMEGLHEEKASLVESEKAAHKRRLAAEQLVRESMIKMDTIDECQRQNRQLERALADARASAQKTKTKTDEDVFRLREHVAILEQRDEDAQEQVLALQLEERRLRDKADKDASQLQQQLDAATVEASRLQKQLRTAETEASQSERRFNRAINDADGKIAEFKDALKISDAILGTTKDRATLLESRITDLEGENRQADDDMSTLRDQLRQQEDAAAAQVASLAGRLRDLEAAKAAEASALRQQVEALGRDKAEAQSECSSLRADNQRATSAAATEASNLRAKLLQMGKDNFDAKSEAAKLRQLVDDVEKAKSAVDTQVVSLSEQVRVLQNEKAATCNEASELRQKVHDVGEAKAATEGEVVSLQGQITVVLQDKAAACNEATKLRQQVDDIEQAKSAVDAQVLSLEEQVAVLQKDEAVARNEAASLRNQLSDLGNEKTKAEDEVSSLRQAIDELKRAKSSVESDASHLRSQARVMQATAETVNKGVQMQMKGLQRTTERAQHEVSQLRVELSTAHARSAESKALADDEATKLRQLIVREITQVVDLQQQLASQADIFRQELLTRADASRQDLALQAETSLSQMTAHMEASRLELTAHMEASRLELTQQQELSDTRFAWLLRRESSGPASPAWREAVREALEPSVVPFGPTRAVRLTQMTAWVDSPTPLESRLIGPVRASTVALDLIDQLLSASRHYKILLHVWALYELLCLGHGLGVKLASRIVDLLIVLAGDSPDMPLLFASWQLVLELSRWPTLDTAADRFLAHLDLDQVILWVFEGFRQGPDSLVAGCRGQPSALLFENEQIVLVACKTWQVALQLDFTLGTYRFVNMVEWEATSFVLKNVSADRR
ncbi:hypothetical protein ACHAQA_005680 [Verticillium albo-atrum]